MTPARPVATWSDEELAKAELPADATVRKDKSYFGWHRAFLTALGAVHPQEAAIAKREAEREAVLAYYQQGFCNAPRWIELRYPSLSPPSPPPLVLANGTRISRGVNGYDIEPTGTIKWRGCSIGSLGQYCTTAEDLTAIAKWLQETKPNV